MPLNSSHDDSGTSGAQLRVRILNSLVFSFRITVWPVRDSLREAGQSFFTSRRIIGLGFCQQNVFLKSALNRDGLCGSVRYDLVLVDASRKFVEAHTVPTEFICKLGDL
jgi:hypothetical protein